MALTKGCCEMKSKRDGGVSGEEVELGLGFVKFTRGLGRKRIVISSRIVESLPESGAKTPLKRQCSGKMVPRVEQSPFPESPVKTPLKRQRSGTMVPNFVKSQLESLPQDLLIRVLCGVDHDDLERLFLVSKSIREAASIAKRSHFAFSTPKKTPAFRNPIDFEEKSSGFHDIEPPNAPIQTKTYRESWTRTKREALSSIAMALFT